MQRQLQTKSRHRMIVPVVRIPYLAPTAATLSRKRIDNNANDSDHHTNQCVRPPMEAAFRFNSTALLVLTPTTTGAGIVSTDFSGCHKEKSTPSILRRT